MIYTKKFGGIMLANLIDDKFIDENDRIAVGVSGGADSMLLLVSLMEKSKQEKFYFKAIHINHHLRDSESDADSLFVKNFCEKNNIDYVIKDVDVKAIKLAEKRGEEESARIARFEAIFDEMKKEKLNKLFLAHHANDQAETILMHIFRGSGILGASGIRSSATVIRPFINLKKSAILNYCKSNNIDFVIDSSNFNNSYTRNYMRNIVLPEIEKVYPNAVDMICSFGERCNEIQTFIEKSLNLNLIVERKDSILIKEEVFNSESFILREYLKVAFEKLKVFSDIEMKHYMLLKDLIGLPVNAMQNYPHGVVAKRVYEGVALYKHQSKKKAFGEYLFSIGKTNIDGYGTIKAEFVNPEDVDYGDGSLYADYYKIPLNAVWRSRKQGDMFAKLGSGSKKLNDYFTDKKIEFSNRDSIPVLAKNENIFMVAGHNISEYIKIDSSTDKIVKISFEQK